MRVNDLYSFDNSNISATLRIDGSSDGIGANAGDILEGLVTSVGKNTHVTFEQLNKREVTFENSAVKNAYAGEKRRFEVVSASADRLVLRDLGGIGAEVEARAQMATQVDLGMPKMVNDFEETMGTKEEEDTDSIKNLSDDDYSELAAEGFSIEDYKAERLIRALDRIKTNRAARRESIRKQGEELKAEENNIRRRAAKAVADKYAAHAGIVDALVDADLPVTDENVAGILNTIAMSDEVQKMTVNSYAYLISRELEPTANNIYRSVYSGSIRRTEITPQDWAGLRSAADAIVEEANERAGKPIVSVRDAHWLVECDIPLTADNLIYKSELENLTATGIAPEEVMKAAAVAIQKGKAPQDAILIASHDDADDETGKKGEDGKSHRMGGAIEQLLGQLNLQQRRLDMATARGTAARASELATGVEAIQNSVDELREQIRSYFVQLAGEIGADEVSVDLAMETSLAVEEVGNAPVTLYGATFTARAEITLKGLADEAGHLMAGRAAQSYEASATQIRADLGDSINKAFSNIDSLLADINMEATDANIRAVRILGHNSMEITAENVESIKYYDAKVTTMVEAMKPAVVMSMIKRGYNPLEQDIDTINREIAGIEAEEGVSPEERFSSFLVRLEAAGDIPEEVRNAYIGIYRLLYQIERSDGAAIGAAVNSGRSLTLGNLLTESRTRRSRGVDASLGDGTEVADTSYTNSITAQITGAFTQIQHERFEYGMQLTKKAADVTSPQAWNQALQDELPGSQGLQGAENEGGTYGEGITEMTLEQLTQRLVRADAAADSAVITAAAENVRNTMTSGGSARKFLKSIGADDSTRNISLMESEGEDLTLGFDSADEMLDAIGNESTLTEAFEQAENRSAAELSEALASDANIFAHASELTREADRFGLLRALAGRQHYRLSTSGEKPARINLTIVRSEEKSGSMSLEVSTARYHVRADLRVMPADGAQESENPSEEAGKDLLLGRITCDSTSEISDMKASLERFVEAVRATGVDAGELTSGVDRLSPDMYLTRLGEMKQRAGLTGDEPEQNRHIATVRLYNIAKLFVEAFI